MMTSTIWCIITGTFGTIRMTGSITENCLLDMAKYTLGLVKYVRD